jgi:hypothetical protein
MRKGDKGTRTVRPASSTTSLVSVAGEVAGATVCAESCGKQIKESAMNSIAASDMNLCSK